MATYGSEHELLLLITEYSSIIKLPTESASTIDKVYPNEEEVFSKSANVQLSKQQFKHGIHVRLGSLRFFKDYTEAHISIDNDNTDDELELSEGDSSASQNNEHFALTDVQPTGLGEKLFIKPNIPPKAFYNSGIIRFEPLDHTKSKAKFQFKIKRKPLHYSYDFTFDVNIAKINHHQHH
jgi:hypothetical protein